MRYFSLLLLCLLLPSRATGQPFKVVSVSPAANLVAAERDAPVVITFNAPVDRAGLDRTTVMVFGRWSGVMSGNFQFEEGDTQVRFVPRRLFSAGETVTVSVARHLASASGETLARGYAWQYWTRPLPATLDLQLSAPPPERTESGRQLDPDLRRLRGRL